MIARKKNIFFWLLIVTLFTSFPSELCKKRSFHRHVQNTRISLLTDTTLINEYFHVIQLTGKSLKIVHFPEVPLLLIYGFKFIDI